MYKKGKLCCYGQVMQMEDDSCISKGWALKMNGTCERERLRNSGDEAVKDGSQNVKSNEDDRRPCWLGIQCCGRSNCPSKLNAYTYSSLNYFVPTSSPSIDLSVSSYPPILLNIVPITYPLASSIHHAIQNWGKLFNLYTWNISLPLSSWNTTLEWERIALSQHLPNLLISHETTFSWTCYHEDMPWLLIIQSRSMHFSTHLCIMREEVVLHLLLLNPLPLHHPYNWFLSLIL